MKLFLTILLLFTIAFGQDCGLTPQEHINIANNVARLQKSDSLQTVQIDDLTKINARLEHQATIDSLLLVGKDVQIDLLHANEKAYIEKIKLVKPSFWENKYLWYIYGSGTMILASIIVGNVK